MDYVYDYYGDKIYILRKKDNELFLLSPSGKKDKVHIENRGGRYLITDDEFAGDFRYATKLDVLINQMQRDWDEVKTFPAPHGDNDVWKHVLDLGLLVREMLQNGQER